MQINIYNNNSFLTNIYSLIMDDPIKVIFKYNNNKERTQYHIYVYVGDIEANIMTILNKIKDLNLYDTLTSLSDSEYKKLEKKYGQYWYKKFFNTHHLNSTINIINKSNVNKKELTDKYGKEWYAIHIENNTIIPKKIYYSYDSIIKEERERKLAKKSANNIPDDDGYIDYTLNKKNLISSINTKYSMSRMQEQKGGDYDGYEYDNDNMDNQPEDDNDIDINYGNNYENNEEMISDEEMDFEDIEDIYKDIDVNPDNNILTTTNLIKKALKDDKLFKKIENNLVDFDTSKDNLIHDEKLRSVFTKEYVTTQYIFKDDTIKTIKNKICCSIKNNPKFGKNSYIIPSRQYLWSEYFFNKEINHVMLGQKWMRKNDILNVDIEPNSNISTYEELRGNLRLLRDNMRRYGSKIKREEDEFNILFDYDGYFTNNDIYMIDAYNCFGLEYNPDTESLKNIQEVFLKLYFPKIKTDDFKYILDYLNSKPTVENNKQTTTFELINNDLILENEIMKDVENVKKDNKFRSIFKENYITQSVIHVNLRSKDKSKIDLFRIFNEFIVNEKYSFMQYQTPDGQIIYKFNDNVMRKYDKNNLELVSKWFINAPYGISFKVMVIENNIEKYMAINLNEMGRIEYKTQWKEEDMATIEDIKGTYKYVRDLIEKINNEKNKVSLAIPDDNEFRYAFINTIQKFELPNKFNVNHNDLSEFSRYFYPYIALVIEPRKRQSKLKKSSDKSKFGTYLRYKRVTKYENQARIEQRILYFMRNYDYNDQSLSSEISKQFNITNERAMEEIEKVRTKYTNIKKSRKILKKLENIPKYKPPGIGIDIQGKSREKYKIRISGARNKKQLDRIIIFMNVLIYLYVETYLFKNKERQILKEKLKKLTNIAKRRSKVDDIVNYDKEVKSVKQMTMTDKKRLGFKPQKGQNQWTRSCQNSGDDKKRQPQQYTNATMDNMLKKGYALNKKTGMYEKRAIITDKNGKKKTVTLRTVKLQDFDADGNITSNELHYACSPKENGEHMYVGFLTRSTNPHGQCMPCCFKKDPMISKNTEKRNYFLKCIGKIKETVEKENKIIGDRLYILQDTNKIQEGRFGFMHKYLDYFFNASLNKDRVIKHHYLINTKNGYFFKYGSKQDVHPFLNAIASLFDTTVEKIKNKLINTLSNDKSELVFTALNNGDIKTQFKLKNKYIDFLKTSDHLDYDLTNHLMSLSGVLVPSGLNIVVFERITRVIKRDLNKDNIKEDFVPICQNHEERDNIVDPKRKTVFILKENRNYYPIVMVNKDDDDTKNIEVFKFFKYKNEKDNIVNHIKDYYIKNCYNDIIENIGHKNITLTAKDMYKILEKINSKKFMAKYQIIDARNKCKYIVTNNSLILPVKPSGSIYHLSILKHMDNKLLDLNTCIDLLNELYKLSNKELDIKPIGVYYNNKSENSLHVVALMTNTYDIIPIKPIIVKQKWLEKNKFIAENKPLFDKIDKEIEKGRDNIVIDKRIEKVTNDNYLSESYQLFRLEFSEYLSKNENIKKKIGSIIKDPKLNKVTKRHNIKNMIYKLSDKELYGLFEKLSSKLIKDQTGGKTDKLIHIKSKHSVPQNYTINNNRNLCSENKTVNKCSINPHCSWAYGNCYLSLTKDTLITFVNKISEELAIGGLKAQEIFRIGDYFVSDIVDYNRFTIRDEQKIIRSTNKNITKILESLFGKGNIPQIGKRRNVKSTIIDYQQMNIDNPLKDLRDFYIQSIIDNNISIFRAYVNGFYWLKHPYYDEYARNLGYYSNTQTDLANFFKSIVIDWLLDNKGKTGEREIIKLMDDSSENSYTEFIGKLGNDISTTTNCIIELYILSKTQKNIPIIVHNDNCDIVYIFKNGILYNKNTMSKLNKQYNEKEYMNNAINIRLSYTYSKSKPSDIEVIYYK